MAQTTIKPRYIDPAGDSRSGSLPVRPPFRFSGVTSRVFPLKANMARLTSFVDAYVNMDIPPEIVHYRPALPYVYLMVLDYGSMSSASQHAQNVGWVSQHEVAFTVPLEIWRMEKGQLVFKDWACVSPFIFVDDEMSLTTGREVYGWPKVAGRVEATQPMWDRHPMAGTRMFTFSTNVFPQTYSGDAESQQVLLQIDTDPLPAYTQVPPNPSSPWAPWSVMAQAARSSLSLAGSALDMALALRSRGYRTNRNPSTLRAMGGRAAGYALEMGPAFIGTLLGMGGRRPDDLQGKPSLAFDNITVKQFRDAQEPDRACYKALVRSRMGVERINRSGLLGDTNLLRGDTSGGYSIRVHRYNSQPIIESLGIEVASTETPTTGAPVSLLKPTFPFWTDVDLYYGAGEPICSRTHVMFDGGTNRDGWVDEQPQPEPPAPAAAEPEAAQPPAPPAPIPMPEFGYMPDKAAPGAPPAPPEACYDFYNTALGAATQPMAGPFHFPDVTLQVYPLLADPERLQRFVNHYLNDPLNTPLNPDLPLEQQTAGMRFETMGSYAYLLVQMTGNQLGTMWSSSNNIGWWADREVQFCVPVKWYRTKPDGTEELVSVAMVAPFVYSSSGRAVITDREVNGRPSVRADISSPQDVWLQPSGPDKPRKYLHLSTEVFPALGYGQKAEQRTLLSIDADDVLPWNDATGWRMVAERWGREVVVDLARKTAIHDEQPEAVADARALALEILGHGAPVNWLVLKQYRDGADVEKACYQALVRTTHSVTRIFDMREIESRVHVRVHRYPGHPIVDTLGLRLKTLDSAEGEVVQVMQPLRPFWMRASMKEELAEVVAVRRADGSWNVAHPWFNGAPPTEVEPAYFQAAGPTRVGAQWQLRPQRLRDQARSHLRSALGASFESVKKAMVADPSIGEIVLAGPQQLLWDNLRQAGSGSAFAQTHSLTQLVALERALKAAGLTWDAEGGIAPRLTRERACEALEKLDDIQVVLDVILSEEWEHWGDPRFFRDKPAKAAHCIPQHSVLTEKGPDQRDLGVLALAEAAGCDAGGPQLAVDDEGWVYFEGATGSPT